MTRSESKSQFMMNETVKTNKFDSEHTAAVNESESTEISNEPKSGEAYDTVLIDESDKKRFICLREKASAMKKTLAQPVIIGIKEVNFSNCQITLKPSETMELYSQDVISVAAMIKAMKNSKQ